MLTPATASAIGPGTYAINFDAATGSSASVRELGTDASCAASGFAFAKSGSVTLTAVGSTVSGSYAVTMYDGTTRSGTFSGGVCSGAFLAASSLCSVLQSGAPSCQSTPTCQ